MLFAKFAVVNLQIRDRDSVKFMSFSYSQKTKCGNIAFQYIITEALIFAGNWI